MSMDEFLSKHENNVNLSSFEDTISDESGSIKDFLSARVMRNPN